MICLGIKISVRFLRYAHFFVYFSFRTASMENTKYEYHKLRQNCCYFFFFLRTASIKSQSVQNMEIITRLGIKLLLFFTISVAFTDYAYLRNKNAIII